MRILLFLAAGSVIAIASCGGSNDALDGPGGAGAAGAAGSTAGGAAGTSGAGGTAGSGVGGEPVDAGGAGGDGSYPDVPPNKTAEQACKTYVGAYCSQLDKCSPIYLQLLWKDAADCEARLVPVCVKALGLSDTAKTPESTAACGDAVAALDCSSLLTRKIPAACTPPAGPRAQDAVCGEDGQCATGYCATPLDQACGTCKNRAADSQPCTRDDDCAYELTCAKNLVCTPFVAKAGECDDNHPCAPGLSCQGVVGPKKGNCVDPAGPGQMCDTQQLAFPGCDLNAGYYCHLLSHVCEKMDLVHAGDDCGVVNNGFAVCTEAAMCELQGGTSGTCLAAAADGEACDQVDGPYCVPASRCVNHVCTAPDPASCN